MCMGGGGWVRISTSSQGQTCRPWGSAKRPHHSLKKTVVRKAGVEEVPRAGEESIRFQVWAGATSSMRW